MKQKQINQTTWKEINLKELGGLIMGQSPKGNTYNNEKKGLPLLNGAADFKKDKIKAKQFSSNPLRIVSKGDLLFCIRATIGKTTISNGDYCLGRGVAGFKPEKENVSSNYLLKILDNKLLKISMYGSTIKGLRKNDIESIKIPLPFTQEGNPDLEKQKQIVSILEKAENLKQKKEEAIKLLDESAKAIFYDMFLKEGNFGEVKLGDVTKIISGSTPSTINESYWNGEINWIAPAELIDGTNYYYYETAKKITLKGLKSCSAKIFSKGTVMLTTRAPIGKVAIAGKEMCSNQGFKNFIPSEKINSVYLYYWFLINKDYLNSIGVGATFKELSKTAVSNIKIPLPPMELQEKFSKIVEKIEKLKEKQKESKKEIDGLFDVLIQKAFAGELI